MSFSVIMEEWQQITPETIPDLRHFYVSDEAEAKAALATIGDSVEFTEGRDGTSIRTTSYIGRLQIGRLELTIRPKIKMRSLLNLLRYAYNLRDLRITPATSQVFDKCTFQDLLIQQLMMEVDELYHRGLRHNYTRQSDMLSTPRGRIELQKIARQGGIVEAALPCEFYPRSADILHNQVLLAGLLESARLTNDMTLRVEVRRLANQLRTGISPIKLTSHKLDQAFREITRLNNVYESAFKLIVLLLEGRGISIEDGQVRSELPGFLFDMNAFWETLLSRFLRENLKGYQVRDQHRSPMMRYQHGYNPQKRQHPTPRPDYVIFYERKIVAILDAKYIDIWNRTPDSKILYQLGMYALGHDDIRRATILYPTVDVRATVEKLDIRDAVYGNQKGTITLCPVNFYELEKLILT